MSEENLLQGKKLFTPGPLSVSTAVRHAMNRDMGSRDPEFIGIVKTVQEKLIEIAGFTTETHGCVLMQGSGTFAVEATLQTTFDMTKKVMILASGAYGRRMGQICNLAKMPYTVIHFPEDQPVDLDDKVEGLLRSGSYGSLALVHCETTSGIISQIDQIGQKLKVKFPSIFYIVDAMSSFGGVEASYATVDFLISSANKCLQGVPGFAFAICRKESLLQCQGRATSLTLDLYDQWTAIQSNGQFRFTPPTHCILALREALLELEVEGGVAGRSHRYMWNNKIIKDGMAALGFSRFISDDFDGHIITSFKYPAHPNFNFEEFYERLSKEGQLIYPGKVTNADCFRIGNIGHLFPDDMKQLLTSIQKVMTEMNIPTPITSN